MLFISLQICQERLFVCFQLLICPILALTSDFQLFIYSPQGSNFIVKTHLKFLRYLFVRFNGKFHFHVWSALSECAPKTIPSPRLKSDNQHFASHSLRKHPFLLALRPWGHFARRNVCDSATEIPY